MQTNSHKITSKPNKTRKAWHELQDKKKGSKPARHDKRQAFDL